MVKARASYPDRMERERARAERAKLDKEGGARAVDLIFAPPEGCESIFPASPIESMTDRFLTVGGPLADCESCLTFGQSITDLLIAVWKSTVVDQLVRPGEGRAAGSSFRS